MDNSESRFGHERYLSDVRSPQGMEDQGQTLVVDRKVVEGYRFVDVLITGGAPWGFTLKGGMEHGELLIITKVEEGSKASDLLMAGDEIVNINDQPISGYRQEAIALVKGSYKTLKMIVKRKNDVACRPHSWHSAKILESPMEILTPQLSKSSGGSAWNTNYHSSSSSHDTWNQANLQRNSGHFSSMGSMDSIDQTYQFGRLSSAKSNSIDQLGNQSKRDSAYGSFSTSFISHDQALSKSGYTSPENLAYKPEWDTTNKVYGKTGALMNEARGYEDKQGYQSPSNLYEYNKTQRTDDLADSRRSSRSNFGPVWHVPDTKKVSSSPPPPLPPLRSDSYAAAKTHERPSAHTQAEITSTQHFTVLNRAPQRPERNSEIADYQQRLVKVTDKTLADMRRISNSSYNTENMDQSASYDKYKNNAPSSSRLQSLSTNDVRFAQPAYNYHQRQHSDESTFFPNKRPLASHKLQQQQLSSITGARDLVSDPARVYDLHHVRASDSSVSNIEGKPNVHCNGQNRLNNTSTNQPPQGTTMQHHYKESSSRPEASTARLSSLHENAATYTQVTSHCVPQQIRDPSPEYCETLTLTEEGEGHLNYYENLSQRKNSEYFQDQCNNHSFAHNDFNDNALSSKRRSHQRDCSLVEDESVKISPQVTPMLHSLTQEGRNRSDTFPEIEYEKQPFSDAGKQSRRSDRFATTLRNEIQQRRARLQKSKSTAALMDSSDADNSECWTQDSMESTIRSSDGGFSSTYKSHLKEAQARVLKATSFQRRDLEPGLADYPSVSPERRTLGSNVSLSPFSPDVSPPSVHNVPTKQNMAATSSQNISRIGGRKRFTAQQKLRSYSEPEKMNEVGIYEESHPQNSSVSKVGVGSFADRWKFFEETSKSTQPMYTSKLAAPSQEEEKNRIHHVKDRERDPPEIWYDKKGRAVSVGHENITDRNRAPRDCDQTHVMYKSTDDLATEQPQRLGTFAEYEASWKEQKKPLERKNSNRCHSADNILDASHEQSPKPQYIHERSRSSPTTDFYAQGAIVNAKKKSADSTREASEISSVTQCSSSTADFSLRITEGENRRDPSQLRTNSAYNNNWKTSDKSPEKVETQDVPRGSRARSGTLPNDYIFVNENVKQGSSYSALPILEAHSEPRNLSNAGDDNHWQDEAPVNKRRGPAPQRPPPPKLDKYLRQNESTSSLTASSESLVSAQSKGLSLSYNPLEFSKGQQTLDQTPVATDEHLSVLLHKPRYSGTTQNENLPLENKHIDSQPPVSTKSSYLQIPGMEPSRSPSPQFAPQKLTDKPPLLVQDANKSRIERVIDNTKVKMVPIKIVHSESHEEKESRNNLLSAVEPPALPTGLAKDQLRTLNTSEQSYSRFCAYTRHDPDTEDRFRVNDQLAHEPVENLKANSPSSHHTSNFKIKVIDADLKSEELMREIVGKDKSLADILDPNTKMKTTMDLMEGIFQKDEHLLEEAQQRRKLHPKVPSPRPADEKKDEQNVTSAISLTTSSAYYSTSAPKAELLIKMKDMQEQQNTESSEDEMDHNLYEKKQELIDSISKKLQVLREAKETLLEDIQSNNALGEEVEVIVKEVCKPNEFDKFRMFIGDLEKIVNLLLSLSGRLARVENALNNLDETASPEERRTLVDKQKLLTTQHEDAKELKENLDRRERIVFDILANYLNEENLADYEHFVKMKSALILEQRELEDKIKLGEEQLKCLTDSLPPDRIK